MTRPRRGGWGLRIWLRACARLVPRDRRAGWLEEWHAEFLHHAPHDGGRSTMRRAAGALPDAWTLRREREGGVDVWMREMRQAIRSALRRPGFTALAAVTLALGVGATTALFSVVDGVLLRPFPYRDADRVVRLVGVRQGDTGGGFGTVSYPNALDVGAGAEGLAGVATFDEWYPALDGPAGAVPVYGGTVNASFFAVLGVDPFLGRFFAPDEEGADRDRVVVVSHGFWREHLGSDPEALGRAVVLNGLSYTLVGVLGPDFEDPGLQGARWGAPQIWRTPWFDPADRGRSGRSFTAVGRLTSGVELTAVQAQVDAVFAGLAETWPEENRDRGVRVVPLVESVVGEARRGLLVLLGAVGLVLLVACVNVANLLLARGAGRRGEMGVRRALGASRRRLVAQLGLESLVLAVVGGALGVGLARLAIDAVVRVSWLPRAADVELDLRALAFASAATLGSALLFGLLPALRTTRGVDPGRTRGATAGRGDGRLRRGLVVAELALCTMLLVGAGLLLRSVWSLYRTDLGLEVAGVLAADVHPSAFGPLEEDDLDPWIDGLLTEVAAVPGVAAVGGIDIVPMSGSFSCDGVDRPDRPAPEGERPCAEVRMVVGDAFDALGMTLRAGRFLDASDRRDGETAAVINQATAALLWPDGDALGATVAVHGAEARVVGIVDDIREAGPLEAPAPMLFLPATQDPWLAVTGRGLTLVVRGRDGDAAALADGVRAGIRAADPAAPVAAVRPLRTLLDRSVAASRVRALVFGGFAAVALGLAVIGVAGVMAHAVARRRREIGVRLAMGADRGDVARMVIAEGLRLTAAGVAVGWVGGALLAGTLDAFLFDVGRWDPWVFLGVPLVLGAAALAACAVPAVRAARLEPTRALVAD